MVSDKGPMPPKIKLPDGSHYYHISADLFRLLWNSHFGAKCWIPDPTASDVDDEDEEDVKPLTAGGWPTIWTSGGLPAVRKTRTDWTVHRTHDGKWVLHGPNMRRIFIGSDKIEAQAACAGLNGDTKVVQDMDALIRGEA